MDAADGQATETLQTRWRDQPESVAAVTSEAGRWELWGMNPPLQKLSGRGEQEASERREKPWQGLGGSSLERSFLRGPGLPLLTFHGGVPAHPGPPAHSGCS